MRIIWPKRPTNYFICVHISGWPADTTCIFIVELCLPFSSFGAFYESPDYHTPKEQHQSRALFPGEYGGEMVIFIVRNARCRLALLSALPKMLFVVIEKDWRPRGILNLE
jgi:hypothetical protein